MTLPNFSDDIASNGVGLVNVSNTNPYVRLFDGPTEQWDTLELWFDFNNASFLPPLSDFFVAIDVFGIDQRDSNNLAASVSTLQTYSIPVAGTVPQYTPLHIPIHSRYTAVYLYGVGPRNPWQFGFDYSINLSRRKYVPTSPVNRPSPLFGTSNGGAVFTGSLSPVQFNSNYSYIGLLWISGFIVNPAGANTLMILNERDDNGGSKRIYVKQSTSTILIPQEFEFVVPCNGREMVLTFQSFGVTAGTDWELYAWPIGGQITR